MGIIAVTSLMLFWLQVPPPPILPPDPAVAEERQRIVSNQHIPEARIFVAARTVAGGEVVFRFVELKDSAREQFSRIFERRENFYDTPGVLGCIGDQYRIDLVWPGEHSDSLFCPDCRRIFPDPESSMVFDVALSSIGARQLHRLLVRATHANASKCAI
jgi:hypothetical protein